MTNLRDGRDYSRYKFRFGGLSVRKVLLNSIALSRTLRSLSVRLMNAGVKITGRCRQVQRVFLLFSNERNTLFTFCFSLIQNYKKYNTVSRFKCFNSRFPFPNRSALIRYLGLKWVLFRNVHHWVLLDSVSNRAAMF